MIEDFSDSYRILDLAPGATLEEVKRSYRELVKVWHPDRFAHDPKLQQKAQEKLKTINVAYERICKGRGGWDSSRRSSSAGTTAAQANEASPPAGSSGSAHNRDEPKTGEQRQPPPQPVRQTNWGQRVMQFAFTVVVFTVSKAVFSAWNSSRKQRSDYSPPYPPSVQSKPKATIGQILEFYDEALKHRPAGWISVQEFSRYMQANQPDYDFSAGFDYLPAPIPPQPESVPSGAVPAAGKGFTNTLGMKFVPVPGTTVQFCIHETRSKDFAAFIADKNRGYTMTGYNTDGWLTYEFKGVPVGRGAGEQAVDSSHPVANISWLDAVAFCEWLTKKEGKTYRLPTDVEWSVAVGLREVTGTPYKLNGWVRDEYPWGGRFVASAISGNYADATMKAKIPDHSTIEGYRDGYATTAPVMSFTANAHGLYDMGGNLWEWVAGCCDGTDAQGKDKSLTSERALRGGSWDDFDAVLLLSSRRYPYGPRNRGNYFGFRVVLVGSGG